VFNPYEEISSCFPFHQRLVLLNVLRIASSQLKKKNISVVDVYLNYIDMCNEYGIESIYKGNILEALKLIELAGFIELKRGVWITKLDLGSYTVDEWIEAICQSPEFDTLNK
jgi:Cdc6-like AAA superfamily ATPase